MLDCWNEVGVWSDAAPSCPKLAEVIHCQNCDVFASAGRGLLDRVAPPGHLEAWSEELSRPKEKGDTGKRVSLFVFRVGDEWLALPMTAVHEVAEPLPVRTIPHRTGGLLAGLVNVRGELHLCFNMKKLLGVEDPANPQPPTANRTIVIGDRESRWVFPADEAWGTLTLSASEIGEVPVTLVRDASAHVSGIVQWERGRISCLDDALLFATLQRRVTHG